MKKIPVTYISINQHRSPLEGQSRAESDAAGATLEMTVTLAKDGRLSDLVRLMENHLRLVPAGDAPEPDAS